MFTRRTKLLRFLLILSELVLLALSFEVAYLIRSYMPHLRLFYFSSGVFVGLLLTALVLWAGSALVVGAYRKPQPYDARPVWRRTAAQTIWFGVALVTAIYFLKLGEISRPFVALFLGINFLLQAAYRLSARKMRRLLHQSFAGPCFYLIVGMSAKALEVAHLIEKSDEHGDCVIGFVREPEGKPLEDETSCRRYPCWELDDVPRMLEEHIIDEIILAVSKTHLEKMENLLLNCEEQGVRTRVLVDFFPHFRSEISLDRLEHLPLLTFSSAPENEYLLFLKRAVDLVLAVALLALASPVMLLAAVLARLTSPGPAIYRQLRCGSINFVRCMKVPTNSSWSWPT